MRISSAEKQRLLVDTGALYNIVATPNGDGSSSAEVEESSEQRRPSFRLSSSHAENYRIDTRRSSRSGSIASSVGSNAAGACGLSPHALSRGSSPAPRTPSPSTHAITSNFNGMAMFDMSCRTERLRPEPPSPDNIEYPRAASWATNKLANVLADDKGKQLFRCFLHESLAEENLNFLDAVDKLKKMKNNDEKKDFAREIITTYSQSINLSASSMNKIKASADSDSPDVNDWAAAIKEVRRLLENDQFPRFRRSETFLNYLELLLPRSYAEKWATSFEALLGNHVGRHHFRLFLRGIRAEENLRFWDAVVEFRSLKNKSTAMANQARDIVSSFLTEGNPNEVFLPFGVKQVIDKRIAENDIDIMLFDEAVKHIEQVLRNDPYVRFLQSDEYLSLLNKLRD